MEAGAHTVCVRDTKTDHAIADRFPQPDTVSVSNARSRICKTGITPRVQKHDE